MFLNFSLQDIFSSILAFALFPLVFVFPGYVCSHIIDLFQFRKRLLPARIAIAVMISMAISPIIFFLAYRIGSSTIAFGLIALFAAGSIIFFWLDRKIILVSWGDSGSGVTIAIWIIVGWSLIAIFSLVDIQWGNRLYFSVVAFDHTTRVSITSAISRTGVPPINPGYFSGNYEYLTFLYYFWYILCSLVDRIGGRWVDARMAMIGSIGWCGIGLMCTISVYLRLRNSWHGPKAWKSALLGIGALAISGLDIFPVAILLILFRIYIGEWFLRLDIEHWNEQITAWLGAIIWVPHHVAGLVACIAGFLLIQSVRGKDLHQQIAAAGIAGLAFASACGLSIFVTAVFVIFWVLWTLFLLLDKNEFLTVFIMMLAGIFSLIAASPYLADILNGGMTSASSAAGNAQLYFPFVFQVRVFKPLLLFLSPIPEVVRNFVHLAVLPLNYFMELGFFFVVGFIWLRKNAKTGRTGNSFHAPEMLLLGASFFVGTFIRSTTLTSNDLGWRGWLFGQFILLIWAVDIGQEYFSNHSLRTYFKSKSQSKNIIYRKIFAYLIVIGILTTIFSLFQLRTWPILIDSGITGVPFMRSNIHLGKRSYAARQAYEYIRDNLPEDVIVQYNPLVRIDRPSGLYGSRQMVAADHSAFGVPAETFQALKNEVSMIFQNPNNDWPSIDQNCQQHHIDVIILNDLDPLWKDLPVLIHQRRPLFRNSYYAVFACGNFANRVSGLAENWSSKGVR